MKNKKLIFVMSLAAILLIASVLVVNAAEIRGVSGSVSYPYGDGVARFELSAHQSATGDVSGMFRYKSITSTSNGWFRQDATVICLAFDEYEGSPAVTIVAQLDHVDEGGDGAPGQYLKFWVVDTGPSNDLAGLVIWPPVDDQPDCDYELPFYLWPAEHGNLVIH
jgi:hypothetical protein